MSDTIEILRFLIDADVSGLTRGMKLTDAAVAQTQKNLRDFTNELGSQSDKVIKLYHNRYAEIKKLQQDAHAEFIRHHQIEAKMTREKVLKSIGSQTEITGNAKKSLAQRYSEATPKGQSKIFDAERKRMIDNSARNKVDYSRFINDYVKYSSQMQAEAKKTEEAFKVMARSADLYSLKVSELSRKGGDVASLTDKVTKLNNAWNSGDRGKLKDAKADMDAEIRLQEKLIASRERVAKKRQRINDEVDKKQEVIKDVSTARTKVDRLKATQILDDTTASDFHRRFSDIVHQAGTLTSKELKKQFQELSKELSDTAGKKVSMNRVDSRIEVQMTKAKIDAMRSGSTANLGNGVLPDQTVVEGRIRWINSLKKAQAEQYQIELSAAKGMTSVDERQKAVEDSTRKYDKAIKDLNGDLAVQRELLGHLKQLNQAGGSAAYKNIYDKVQLDIIKNSASTVAKNNPFELSRAMAESKAKIEAKRLEQEKLSHGLAKDLDTLPGGSKSMDDPANKKEIIRLTKEYETALRSLNAERKKEQDNFSTLNNQYQTQRKMLYDIQNAATNVMYVFGAMAIGIGSFMKKVADSFGEVESKLNTFKSVTFEAGESMDLINMRGESFKKTVLDMSKNSSFAASEIIDAATSLGKMGFTVDEVKKSLHGIVTAAEATGESLVTVAETVSSVLNQFNMTRTSENIEKVTDILSYVANKTAASFSSLNESLKYVGPIADAAGESLSDTAGILGFLSDRSILGSTGATVLTNAFLRLAKITPEVAKVLNAMGVQTFDPLTKQQFKLKDILVSLADKMKGMGSSTRLAATELIFGERAAKGMAAALTKITDDKDSFLTFLDDVDSKSKGMTEAVKQVGFAGFKVEVEKLQHSFEALTDQLGNSLAPTLTLIVQSIKHVVDSFAAMPDDIQNATAQIGLWTTGLLGAVAVGALAIKSITGIYQAFTLIVPILSDIGFGFAALAGGAATFGETIGLIMAAPFMPWILGITAALGVLGAIVWANKDAWEAERAEQDATKETMIQQTQLRKDLISLIQKEAEGHKLNAEELMKEAAAFRERATQAKTRVDAINAENEELKKRLSEGLSEVTTNSSGAVTGVMHRGLSDVEKREIEERIKLNEEEAKSIQYIASGYDELANKKVLRGENEKLVQGSKDELKAQFDKLMTLKRLESSSQSAEVKLNAQKQLNDVFKDYLAAYNKVRELQQQGKISDDEAKAELEDMLFAQKEVGDLLNQNMMKDKDTLEIIKQQNDERRQALDLLTKQVEIQDKMAYGRTLGVSYDVPAPLPSAELSDEEKKAQQDMITRNEKSENLQKQRATEAEQRAAEEAGIPKSQLQNSAYSGARGLGSQEPGSVQATFSAKGSAFTTILRSDSLTEKMRKHAAEYNKRRAFEEKKAAIDKQTKDLAAADRKARAGYAGFNTSADLNKPPEIKPVKPTHLVDLSQGPARYPAPVSQPGYTGSAPNTSAGTAFNVNANLADKHAMESRVATTKAALDRDNDIAMRSYKLWQQKLSVIKDQASKDEAEKARLQYKSDLAARVQSEDAYISAKNELAKRFEQDDIARQQRARDRNLKTLEIEASEAELTYSDKKDDIEARHKIALEKMAIEFEAENSNIYKLYENATERDAELKKAKSDYDRKILVENKKNEHDLQMEKLQNAKTMFDIQSSLSAQLVDLMPQGISKSLAEIKQKYEKTRFDLQQQVDNPELKPEARTAAKTLYDQSRALEAIETNNARFAAQSKMLDIQREKLNLLQQQTAVGRDLSSVMQSISQSDASTNLVDMVNSFNDLTKDVKELSFSDIADEIENDLNTQIDAMNEKYAANAEQIAIIMQRHKEKGQDSEAELATDDELQGLISANLSLEIQRNDAIKARKTLLSDEFKEYAAIKEQLDDIKKAYTSINEAGNNLADALSGLTGGDALGGGLKDMLKLGETAIGFTDKLIKAKAQMMVIQDKSQRESAASSPIPAELLSRGVGVAASAFAPASGIAAAGTAAMSSGGAAIGAGLGGAAAAAFPPAMLLALLPLLPDIIKFFGDVGTKLVASIFPLGSEETKKWTRDNIDSLNEILDQRDQILLERGDMSEALFSERNLNRLQQKYENAVANITADYKKKRDDANNASAGEGAIRGGILGALGPVGWMAAAFTQGMANKKTTQQNDILNQQEEEAKKLEKDKFTKEANKQSADSYRRSFQKENELAQSANDLKRINAALGHSQILTEQADFEKQKLDLDQKANEDMAKLMENPESLQEQALYNARFAENLKEQEKLEADHNERLAAIQDQRNQTQRDNDLQAIQLDLNLSDHQKKIAEIRAEEASKQAELDAKRRTADPADYSAIDEAKRLAHLDMLHKLADEARNASEALLALDRSLAATRAALTPDKNDDLKAALDSDLDAIRNAAYEQRRIHAGEPAELAKIDDIARNQSLAKIREFNQQVMANQIEVSRRESAIKVAQLEQSGSMEESIRATALGQAQALIDELEALAKTSGRFSQEFILKSQETQNQIYALAVDQYQKIVDLRRQDLSDFIEIETLKYQNAKDIMGQAYAETKGNIYQLQLDRMAIQNGPKNEANARKLAIIDAKIQQERIQGVKKEGDAAIEKLNEIKTIRQEIYDADTRTYELDILKYQIQIDALQKQIDAANKRKHEIEADTNAKKAEFDIQDKGKFQAALGGMNLSDEMKSALEYVSNPVKNQPLSYSYQAALDAANAQAKLKESQAGADYALENISQSQYSQQMQDSALQRALLAKYALSKIDAQHQTELTRLKAQGKTTDELRVVEKHQMDEKSAALEMYAKAYTDWQTYYKEGIDGQYQYELQAIDASVTANQDKANALEDQQKELQMKMKEMSNQMALDMLPVDQAIRDITAQTRGWGYTLDQVRAGMGPLVAEVQSSFATMKASIESIKPLEIPVTIPNLQNIMNQLTGLQQAVFSGAVGDSYTPSSYSGGSSSSSSDSSSEWTPVVSDSSSYNPYTQTAPSDSGINTNANWSAGGDSEWFSSGYTATGYASGGYTGDGIGIGDKLLAKVGASEWIIPNRDFRSYSNDLVAAALARASYQNIQGGSNYFTFGNVYGVDDLEAAIAGGITKASKASGFTNSNYLTGSF